MKIYVGNFLLVFFLAGASLCRLYVAVFSIIKKSEALPSQGIRCYVSRDVLSMITTNIIFKHKFLENKFPNITLIYSDVSFHVAASTSHLFFGVFMPWYWSQYN